MLFRSNGQALFFTTNASYLPITVTIYGQTGYITSYTANVTYTSCAVPGCASFTLPAGTYSFYATDNNGHTWNSNGLSTVTVPANGCAVPTQLN